MFFKKLFCGRWFSKKKSSQEVVPQKKNVHKEENRFPPIINGNKIPYWAPIEDLKKELEKPVGIYITVVCALARYGTLETYEILARELKNKDYYKRRAALEYISKHELWDNDSVLLRGLVLDSCEYTVLLALKLIDQYENFDLDEEVKEAYLTWSDHKDISCYCEKYFARRQIDMTQLSYDELLNEEQDSLLNKAQIKAKKPAQDNFYANTDISQNAPWKAKKFPEKYKDYQHYLWKYYPELSEEQIDQAIYNLSKYGCGYASFVSALMRFYEDKQIAFFQKFSLKYYDDKGENNGDDLIVLMYACCGMERKGLTMSELLVNIGIFKKIYDIKVSVKRIQDPQQFLRKENAYVIIMAGDFVLENSERKVPVKENHYMNLVRITKNGDYEVISWGKKYMLSKKNIRQTVYYLGIQFDDL